VWNKAPSAKRVGFINTPFQRGERALQQNPNRFSGFRGSENRSVGEQTAKAVGPSSLRAITSLKRGVNDRRPALRANRTLLVLVTVTLALGASAFSGTGLRVETLKCESATNPLGLDTPRPRLSWILESNERGQSQTAYRILAASASGKLSEGQADLWDSGKVTSSESIQVSYGGNPLHSGQHVYWKVRVWDRSDKPSAYSQPAWWEMGLLQPGDWRATWISRPRSHAPSELELFQDDPAPFFRKEFGLEKKVRRARVYVSGLGYYELRLNGQRVGDHMLDPGWTTYSKRVLYSTYDVTDQLKRGSNALGVMLGNGWFNPLPLRMWNYVNLRENLTVGEPRVILQLAVEFTDGTSQTIVTDQTWRVAGGPILRNSIYLGEVYDARKEQQGWDRKGFDDSRWGRALDCASPLALSPPAPPISSMKSARGLAQSKTPAPLLGPLRAQEAPPILITRRLKPVKLTEPKPGTYIFDFGQNFAGWARLRVRGSAGTHVKLRYGELLYPDGTLNGMTAVCGQIKQGGRDYRYDGTGTPKTAWQMDEYILKGGGEEIYTPRFTFHGFRYVEAIGFPGRPTLEALEGLRLNSDVTPAGSFTCSNPLLNRIQEMVLWTELSNLFSVESDCPHREKFGYGGDIVAASEMAIFNFDMTRFYGKAIHDLADAVRPNGGFTETAPFVGIASEGLGEKAGPIGWGTAQPLLQWQLYQYYGDRRLLEEQYDTTRRWFDFLQSRATEDLIDNGISDHESLVPKPRALTGAAFYYLNAKLFSQIARVLGKQGDADHAAALAEKIKIAFNRKFLQPGTGRYDSASQAYQAFALYLDLVPPEEKDRALDALVRDITESHQGHLTTGIFGTKFMLNALTELGRVEVAYAIANQRTFPSWGHMLENGATTLWEHWEFSDNTYSHNHPMFGSVSEWFYKALAGINPAPDAVGFDTIIIKPQPVGDLQWVKASYNSVRGQIISEWRREGGQFKLRVRVPVGATATVVLPVKGQGFIRESGKPIERALGVQILRREIGSATVAVGSGEYDFSSVFE
jgi:alpha-L-rhamnosidase